jgi:hypothetical protein
VADGVRKNKRINETQALKKWGGPIDAEKIK